jgi:Gas vesicle synthesis protein GvpL/GvpF
MSARKREKKKRLDDKGRKVLRAGEQVESSALYVYCIGESRSLATLPGDSLPPAIEDGHSLELIEGNNLAAVVSRVPLKDYNEEALQDNLVDPAWTALRAMRHERVVDYFAKRKSIVPLRFGTIYLERAGIERMLAERTVELRATIERLGGREEWGVNIFCDRKALMDAIVNYSPRLRELNEQAASASPGQAYLMRKKMDAMRTDEARAEIKRTVERIEQELQKQSDGATRLRMLKDEAGAHGELVGKLAFLVERARFDEFRRGAERLAREHEGAGIKLELTGPWPAYNFVSSNEKNRER